MSKVVQTVTLKSAANDSLEERLDRYMYQLGDALGLDIRIDVYGYNDDGSPVTRDRDYVFRHVKASLEAENDG